MNIKVVRERLKDSLAVITAVITLRLLLLYKVIVILALPGTVGDEEASSVPLSGSSL